MPELARGWTSRGWNPGGGWGGEIFRTHSDVPCGPPSLLYSAYQVILGVERRGRGVDHPPPFSAEVQERVQLRLLPVWVFMASSRANFTILYA
jgi:hypothetical protein